jgi:hypothetical protein
MPAAREEDEAVAAQLHRVEARVRPDLGGHGDVGRALEHLLQDRRRVPDR